MDEGRQLAGRAARSDPDQDRGQGTSDGGERLPRGHDGLHPAAAAGDVRRDARSHQGGRQLGSGPGRRLELLRRIPHRRPASPLHARRTPGRVDGGRSAGDEEFRRRAHASTAPRRQ